MSDLPLVSVPPNGLAFATGPLDVQAAASGNAGGKKLSVRASLWLAFSVLLVLAVLALGFSLLQMRTINASTKSLFEEEYTGGQAVEQVRGLIFKTSRSEAQLLTASTEAERKRLGDEVLGSLAKISDLLGVVQRLANTADMKDQAQQLAGKIASWDKDLHDYVTLVQAQPIDLVQMSPDVGTSDAILLSKAAKIEVVIDSIVKLRAASAQSTMENADRVYSASLGWTTAAIALMLLAAVLISGVVIRRLHQQLGGEPDVAKEISSSIAHGDLTRAIAVGRADNHSLMYSLRAMQESLQRLVSEVRGTSQQVASASAEIAAGNHDLSARTEVQASSLQQTTAQMGELDASIQRNLDGVRQVSSLANSASDAAARGGDVVGQVIETMRGINEASRRITEIISVIDGIAFQTNILALNAAVEAARAGEQGRGFAVVASEVRSLAGRSAEAAKEIKALIDNSVRRVDQGTLLVDKAGTTMEEVVSGIRNVTALITQISAAGSEQASRIAEIGSSLNQMDQSTQQNAALVEEMAAAASSLKAQAHDLVDAVMVFRTAA